jgi:cytochrome P450
MNAITDSIIPIEFAAKLTDPSVYASDELFKIYAWLRANNPLGIAQVESYDPFWVVTKHQDILDISKDNKLFPYGDRPSTFMDAAGAVIAMQLQNSPSPLVLSLIQMDPPVHAKYRMLTQSWFMPINVKKREEEIREIARKSISRMAETGGEVDFVKSVALNYPLEVIMNILGVPEEDFPLMLKLTQEIFGPLDPDTQALVKGLSIEDISQLQQAVIGEFLAYFTKIAAARRESPADDLATVLVNAQIDGKPISEGALSGYYLVIATAGHDTTSSTASVGMWALATQPGLLERLKADLSLLPAFVDECIRWASPVKTFMRSAAEDVEIRGRLIRKGDWLMLCYASGNRDADAFENPDIFDIDRKSNKHVAFGFGPHMCLGQHLAKMEIRILFEELLPRLKSVKLAGEPLLSHSYFVNGLKSLPITFEASDKGF